MLFAVIGFMSSLTKVRGYRTADDDASPLAVDSSLELYGIILMLVICTIALWEMGRSCYRSHNEAVRLRSLQTDAKLSKKELRTLNAYLKRNPTDLSSAEKEEMVSLADQAGVDLTGILRRSSARESESSSRTSTRKLECLLRLHHRPWQRLVRRMSSFSTGGGVKEPLLVAAEVKRPSLRRRQGGRSVFLGPKMLGYSVTWEEKFRKKVYMTPKGTCVHASTRCPTLNCSTKFQERDVCQRCIKGQKEEVDVRGQYWP